MSKLKLNFTDNLIPSSRTKTDKVEQGNPPRKPEQTPKQEPKEPTNEMKMKKKPLVSVDEMFASDEPLHTEPEPVLTINSMTPTEFAMQHYSTVVKTIRAGRLTEEQLLALQDAEQANRKRKVVLKALAETLAPKVDPEEAQDKDDQGDDGTPENSDGDTQKFGCANTLIENTENTFLASAPQGEVEQEKEEHADPHEELQVTLQAIVDQAERMRQGVYLQVGDSDLYGSMVRLAESAHTLQNVMNAWLSK